MVYTEYIGTGSVQSTSAEYVNYSHEKFQRTGKKGEKKLGLVVVVILTVHGIYS